MIEAWPELGALEIDAEAQSLIRKGTGGNPIKRLKGSGRRIKDPLQTTISNARNLVLAAHRRMVLDSIIGLAKIEGFGHIIEEVPVDQVPAATRSIEDLLNQDVDIIIARAEDSAAIGASIRAAEDAGVPFITFDRSSATTQPTAHVGGDSYLQALSTAQTFVEILEENGVQGQCIELQGALTDINAVNRSEAWNEVDELSDTIETIAQVPTEWNPELFLSGATNALQANPDANCMFVASDFALAAVQSALEGADRWVPTGEEGHVWLATQDLFPVALEAMSTVGVRPVTTTSSPSSRVSSARVASSSVVWFEEMRTPSTSGARYSSFCRSVPTSSSVCMFPSSGASTRIAGAPSSDRPASSKTGSASRKSSPIPPHSSPICGQ